MSMCGPHQLIVQLRQSHSYAHDRIDPPAPHCYCCHHTQPLTSAPYTTPEAHMPRHIPLITLTLLLTTLTAHGQLVTVHVSPTGNDAAAGTAAAPLRSVARAMANTAAATATVIDLAPGTHDLGDAPLALRGNVTLRGAGPDATTLRGSLTLNKVTAVAVENLTLAGNAAPDAPPLPVTAIVARDGTDLTLRQLRITGYTQGGIVLERWRRAAIDFCTLVDTTENTYKRDRKTPAKQSTAILIGDVTDTAIRHCTIDTSGAGGRGIGTTKQSWGKTPWADPPTRLIRLEIAHCTITVDQWHAWNVPDTTTHPPQMTIELWHAFSEDVEIHHCKLNNNVSLSADPDGKTPPAQRTVRMHHNRFDLIPTGQNYRYAVEPYVPRFRFDHNLIIHGIYPIATWGKTASFEDMMIHHNIFYGTGDSQALINSLAALPGLTFAHNTVYLTTRQQKPMATFTNPEEKNTNQRIVNNLFLSTVDQAAGIGFTLGVANNGFWRVPPTGKAPKAAVNAIAAEGAIDIPFFAPRPNGPAIDAATVLQDLPVPAAGKAPDLGAIEAGLPLWQVGPQPAAFTAPATRPRP